jgi:hypothetical protein
MTKYNNATQTRRMSRTLGGRFRGGKLAPVMAEAFRESESGILSQTVSYELDPIAGRMITPITAELVSVFVPVQAVDALKNPTEDYAGITEVIRDKLLSGSPLFDLETESEISKRLGVNPVSISGVKKVNEIARLAHNAAVNHLRLRKYVNAVQLLAGNMDVTPSLISETVLDRLNGVLDPEDRVDGAVKLDFGSISLPVDGIGILQSTTPVAHGSIRETESFGEVTGYGVGDTHGANKLVVQTQSKIVDGYATSLDVPAIYANMAGVDSNISLTDFYNAEKMDELVRQMRVMIDSNPQYGEEMVTRWAHGLSVDTGKVPYVIHESTKTFGQIYRQATDGANLDIAQSDMVQEISFTVPVAPTELGGIVITFASVKPDETLASQPHPFLSEEWGAINYVSDELARDPEAVTIRQLNSDCSSGDEGTTALYIGHNHLKKSYVAYGFNRHLDTTTVASKTALWQLEVPMSVTPETVLYPETLSHYPFADQTAEICTYTINSVQTVRTPLVFGPTPVEELAQIETDDLFQDA